jgi:hypothetical protein
MDEGGQPRRIEVERGNVPSSSVESVPMYVSRRTNSGHMLDRS